LKTKDRRLRALTLSLVWLLQFGAAALAQSGDPQPFFQRLTPQVVTGVFPEATRVEALDDGGPRAAAAYAGDELKGYIFSTLDVLNAPGYSSTPFDIVAGVTLTGKITGSAVLFHREPYLLNDDERTGLLVKFLDSLKGTEGKLGSTGGLEPGFVAGATVSARAMRNAVLEGAGLVLRYRTGAKVITEPTVDLLSFRPLAVADLVADGSLASVVVTNADLAAAAKRAGLEGLPLDVPPRGNANAVYLEFRAGYAMPPLIGRNAAGQGPYHHLSETLGETGQALIFGSNGTYDHLGSKYNNLSHEFRLERIAVLQDDKRFEFQKSDLITIDYALGRVANIFALPKDSGFDPLKPWQAEVYAFAHKPDGSLARFLLTSLSYQLPSQYILLPEPEARPAWMEAWIEGRVEVAAMIIALVLLTLVFVFQDRLSQSRRAHRLIRVGFLLFTLVWIGWIAGAQLSIVHVINYLKAPFDRLSIGF
jgi:NosR/NirI family nitrous oxide reductase transcriptional regulator